MQMEKWFKLLVLGGAALATVSCTDMKEPDAPEPVSPPADGGQESDSGSMHSAMDSGTSPDAMSAPDSGPTDTGAMLMCSTPAAPGDPCGCPCCWAVGYLNTDPECSGFCMAGNNGLGCCE